MKKKLWLGVLAGILVVIAAFLLVDRMIPKEFEDLCPNMQKPEACRILYAAADGSNMITLAGAELEELLSVLERLDYYKGGSYGSVMEGNNCHLFFSAQGEEQFTLHVSDAGKVYTQSSYYDFAPGVSPTTLSSYLQTLF